MKTYNPSVFVKQQTSEMRMWVQSVHSVLTQGVDMGAPKANGTHASDGTINAGVYTQFERGNGSGILIRVDGSGVAMSNAPYKWTAGTSLQISHGLQRQPIGFIVVDKDKPVDVYRTASPTDKLLTVQATDTTASTTLYIF